jgi:hypothetical protein
MRRMRILIQSPVNRVLIQWVRASAQLVLVRLVQQLAARSVVL